MNSNVRGKGAAADDDDDVKKMQYTVTFEHGHENNCTKVVQHVPRII